MPPQGGGMEVNMKLRLLFILVVCAAVGMSACGKQLYYDENDIVTESEETEIDSTEVTDNVDEFLNQEIICSVKDEMESLGWENISIDEGWGNWQAWGEGSTYLPPEELEEDMRMYTLWGTVYGSGEGPYNNPDNSLDIIVQIVFDDDNPDGYIYNVIYTSRSGRDMDSDTSLFDFLENNEILSTDTESLWAYMYSY
ncbi:MAG: hypothetical protein LUG52_06185 [Clostridia bacterium]|nr:hypothetical protein [Clostridia bacterium]